MRVVVDDSGSHDQTIRVNHPSRLTAHSSDLDDTPVAHTDIGVKPRQPRTIYYFAVPDD
jgi:hypothetical protein